MIAWAKESSLVEVGHYRDRDSLDCSAARLLDVLGRRHLALVVFRPLTPDISPRVGWAFVHAV